MSISSNIALERFITKYVGIYDSVFEFFAAWSLRGQAVISCRISPVVNGQAHLYVLSLNKCENYVLISLFITLAFAN